MSLAIQKTLKSLLKKVERRANYLYKYYYRKYIHIHYDNLIIENLMCNGRCHVVAVFKNYLIEDDNSEYLRRFYKHKESVPRLKKFITYHDETSVIFPNYTPLVESKYLYNNVIRKQRIIDEQQNLEFKKNDKKSKKYKDFFNKEDKVFNSTIFGEIFSQSESVLRIIFGIEKKEKEKEKGKEKNNKDVPNELNLNLKDDYYNKHNNDFDDSEYIEVKQLIKKVENAEVKINNENNNSLGGYKLNNGNNKPMKYKLKSVNTANNDNQSKNKNYEKLNSISINSTNNTNSSNNNIINSNINLNRMKNKQSMDFKNKLKSNKKIRNSLTITNSNMKKEKNNFINSNKNLTIPTHKHSKSHIPNRTLYGLNFHSNNNNIFNNLMNQEKKLRVNNNSKSLSNNASRINTVSNTNTNILNTDFPHNSKTIIKQNNYITNNKFNSAIKSDKLLSKIPKINIDNLNIINNENNSNKILTITNRDSNMNHNYILNNPKLFFTETQVLKTDRNFIKKRSQKKDIIKSMMNQAINSSPSYTKSKAIFDRNSNRNLVIINEANLRTISQSRNNKQYFSNKNINKTPKKILINEYNFKNNPELIKKGNSTNKYKNYNYGI